MRPEAMSKMYCKIVQGGTNFITSSVSKDLEYFSNVIHKVSDNKLYISL